jgi:hypothetical protein
VALHQHFSPGKVVLFVGSAIVSMAIAMIIGAAASSFFVGLLALAVAFPAYVYVGAHAIRAAEDLMTWGFPGEERWTTEQRLMYGAAWPVIVLFWLVVSGFNRVVTRLYQ